MSFRRGDAHIAPPIGAQSPIFQNISGSGAGAETILDLMPLAWNLQTCGTHFNNLPRCGAREGSPETIRFLAAFFAYFLPLLAKSMSPKAAPPKHGASGTPPPTDVGRSPPARRRADAGITPYGNTEKRTQTRKTSPAFAGDVSTPI